MIENQIFKEKNFLVIKVNSFNIPINIKPANEDPIEYSTNGTGEIYFLIPLTSNLTVFSEPGHDIKLYQTNMPVLRVWTDGAP